MAQKLQVTFRGKPIGVLDAADVDMDEAQRLEDTAGLTYNEMIEGVARSSAKATRSLVWFLRLRAGEQADLWEKFTFGDVDIKVIGDETDPTVAADGGETNPSDSESAGSGTSPSSRTTSD